MNFTEFNFSIRHTCPELSSLSSSTMWFSNRQLVFQFDTFWYYGDNISNHAFCESRKCSAILPNQFAMPYSQCFFFLCFELKEPWEQSWLIYDVILKIHVTLSICGILSICHLTISFCWFELSFCHFAIRIAYAIGEIIGYLLELRINSFWRFVTFCRFVDLSLSNIVLLIWDVILPFYESNSVRDWRNNRIPFGAKDQVFLTICDILSICRFVT